MTRAFEIFEVRKTSSSRANLRSAIVAWQRSPKYAAERNSIGAQRVSELVQFYNASDVGEFVTIKSTGTQAVGARLYKPGDPQYELDGDTMLPVNQRLVDFTPSEIQLLNETIRRTKAAVRAARDLMIGLAAAPSMTAPYNAGQQVYIDFFGAYDQTRAGKVMKNFRNLCIAVDSPTGPIMFDHRNTDFGEDCFAACKRANILVDVKIWLGRDMFNLGRATFKRTGFDQKETYRNTTDALVGTLVHEFSHGVCNTVDVPPVHSNGSWKLTPDAVTWESPDNDIQASTRKQDKRVAAKEPQAAIVMRTVTASSRSARWGWPRARRSDRRRAARPAARPKIRRGLSTPCRASVQGGLQPKHRRAGT